MPLVVDDLAKIINDSLGVKDGTSKPIEITSEMKTYAKAIIDTFHACTTAHSVGTVNGGTAAASPLIAGLATGGLLVGFLPATWTAAMASGFPKSNPAALALEATASTGYIALAAKINYKAGSITGITTNTPLTPGILTLGAGQDGTVDALDGTAWSALVVPPLGDPARASKLYKDIVAYISKNAKCSYAIGTVQGTAPTGGGPLTLGLAVGGTIS